MNKITLEDYDIDENAVATVETDETIIDEYSIDRFTYPNRKVYEECKRLEREIQLHNTVVE